MIASWADPRTDQVEFEWRGWKPETGHVRFLAWGRVIGAPGG